MSFTFKQFHLADDQCAMKVGTDSILLGSWADISSGDIATPRVLDIGCGSGLLSLMLAQRLEGKGQLVGIEIDREAVRQARDNIRQSPWPEKITVVHSDINGYVDGQKSDVIIANPPYFIDSLRGPKLNRNTARHTDGLTQQQLLDNVARLLAPDGVFYLILPVNEAQQLMAKSEAAGLFLSHQCEVQTKAGKPASRCLMGFSKVAVAQIKHQNMVIYDENNLYSSQFIALTRNFYLNG
ncbi:MAG: tRNA1Val (adenine37-N6)-methyltransferase [Phenylobacterium sp.]|jgi:tRNA1Val (adenine37-N6)-methyltransferase